MIHRTYPIMSISNIDIFTKCIPDMIKIIQGMVINDTLVHFRIEMNKSWGNFINKVILPHSNSVSLFPNCRMSRSQ